MSRHRGDSADGEASQTYCPWSIINNAPQRRAIKRLGRLPNMDSHIPGIPVPQVETFNNARLVVKRSLSSTNLAETNHKGILLALANSKGHKQYQTKRAPDESTSQQTRFESFLPCTQHLSRGNKKQLVRVNFY